MDLIAVIEALDDKPEEQRREFLEDHVVTAFVDLQKGDIGSVEAYLEATQDYGADRALSLVQQHPSYKSFLRLSGALDRAEKDPAKITVEDEMDIYSGYGNRWFSDEVVHPGVLTALDGFARAEVAFLKEHPGFAYGTIERVAWAARRDIVSNEEATSIIVHHCNARAYAAFGQAEPDNTWIKHGLLSNLFSLDSLHASRAQRGLPPLVLDADVDVSRSSAAYLAMFTAAIMR